MVFFFIAYLIIIIIFCFPFDIGICYNFDKKSNNSTFLLKLGIFSKYIQKKNKNRLKKNKDNFKISLKSLSIKKPINVRVSIDASLPNFCIFFKNNYSYILRSFCFNNLDNVQILHNVNIANNSQALYLQFKLSLKLNVFLIFSSLVQTLKLKRR